MIFSIEGPIITSMYDKWFGGGECGVDDRFQWMGEDVIDLPFLALEGVQNLRISEKSDHW